MTSFRLIKHVGISFGIMPYSNVGYNYSYRQLLPEVDAMIRTSHSGSGGLNQLILGAGWQIFKPLSIGFNFA